MPRRPEPIPTLPMSRRGEVFWAEPMIGRGMHGVTHQDMPLIGRGAHGVTNQVGPAIGRGVPTTETGPRPRVHPSSSPIGVGLTNRNRPVVQPQRMVDSQVSTSHGSCGCQSRGGCGCGTAALTEVPWTANPGSFGVQGGRSQSFVFPSLLGHGSHESPPFRACAHCVCKGGTVSADCVVWGNRCRCKSEVPGMARLDPTTVISARIQPSSPDVSPGQIAGAWKRRVCYNSPACQAAFKEYLVEYRQWQRDFAVAKQRLLEWAEKKAWQPACEKECEQIHCNPTCFPYCGSYGKKNCVSSHPGCDFAKAHVYTTNFSRKHCGLKAVIPPTGNKVIVDNVNCSSTTGCASQLECLKSLNACQTICGNELCDPGPPPEIPTMPFPPNCGCKP